MRIPWAVLARQRGAVRLGAGAVDKSAGAERPGALGSGGAIFDDADSRGFLRLDKETGAVSFCTVDAGLSVCRVSADERAALENEIARLRRDNAELKTARSPNAPGILRLAQGRGHGAGIELYRTLHEAHHAHLQGRSERREVLKVFFPEPETIMSNENPFAKWPHIDASKQSEADSAAPRRELPGSTTQGPAPTPNQNALESFLGGTPASVFVKLLFISLVVGALLMWLDIRPAIFSAAFRIS